MSSYVVNQLRQEEAGKSKGNENKKSEGFPDDSDGKESAANAGDSDLIPGSGRSPREGNGNLLQYSCLENSMDRGALWATVHRVTKRHH